MKLFTLGFTQKSASQFFELLKQPGLKRVIDIRLNNVSQLAGFTKKDDLQFFLREIPHIDYVHSLDLAPTQEILDEYKKNKGDWKVFEKKFLNLMKKRKVETLFPKTLFDGACLLCSEPSHEHCHRHFVAEYLKASWGNIDIIHL
ncbi:DUF488 domain-containing protein [Leptospira fluminis]|uniref:DUF488 domain-containing protein n=1 Tax=Leptospira fluminis TaxID=2484979 RepID=A0A4R9GQU1_9LEPT|nr:DUF488 domain-containing protein [Leptospira fluminis]TGK20060.1 DUF488 domain-containing protein [Leptospira fluminis]